MFARKAFPPSPIPNSFWVVPRRLLAGEYPGTLLEEDSVQRLEALVAAGVSFFLDLTEENELSTYDQWLPQLRRVPAAGGIELPLMHSRWPIEDHGLPDTDETMCEILNVLDKALADGHVVYVHCRAGIGRTNTVTGCWLKRQGMAGPAALKHLNRLWKANASSAAWPRVPEPNQKEFVLAWQDSKTNTLRQSLRKPHAGVDQGKYLGALFGTACGDALGATVQGKRAGHFEPVSDFRSPGAFKQPRGAWTDDTAMFLCLAHSLLEKNGFNAVHQADIYWEWHQNGFMSATGNAVGKVSSISTALAATRWSGMPFAGPPASKLWDAESLVRVGAIVLYARRTPAKAIQWAADSSRIINQSPGVLDACRLYAAILLAAIEGATKLDLLPQASRLLSVHHGQQLKPELKALTDSTALPFKAPGVTAPTAVAVLHRVLWVLGESNDFRDGLLRLVNMGGHSDIQGALYGQIAGVLYGVEAIPEAWLTGVLRPELLDTTALRLLAAASARAP